MPKCIQGFVYKDLNRLNMAKLYWRVKKDGKWTWTPAIISDEWSDMYKTYVFNIQEDIA